QFARDRATGEVRYLRLAGGDNPPDGLQVRRHRQCGAGLGARIDNLLAVEVAEYNTQCVLFGCLNGLGTEPSEIPDLQPVRTSEQQEPRMQATEFVVEGGGRLSRAFPYRIAHDVLFVSG